MTSDSQNRQNYMEWSAMDALLESGSLDGFKGAVNRWLHSGDVFSRFLRYKLLPLFR